MERSGDMQSAIPGPEDVPAASRLRDQLFAAKMAECGTEGGKQLSDEGIAVRRLAMEISGEKEDNAMVDKVERGVQNLEINARCFPTSPLWCRRVLATVLGADLQEIRHHRIDTRHQPVSV